jgi:hypothetical protein
MVYFWSPRLSDTLPSIQPTRVSSIYSREGRQLLEKRLYISFEIAFSQRRGLYEPEARFKNQVGWPSRGWYTSGYSGSTYNHLSYVGSWEVE